MAKTKIKPKSKTKQLLHNRTMLEWILFVILLLLLAAFLVSRSDWWFWPTDKNLGTAFQTSHKVAAANASGSPVSPAGTSGGGSTTTRTSGSSTTSSTTSTSGGSGGGSSTGGGSGGGSGGGGSSTPSPLLDLAANLNTGDSRQSVEARVNGLGASCSVVANLPLLGQQQVCVYNQNGTTLTVTYLNDRVLSASLSNL